MHVMPRLSGRCLRAVAAALVALHTGAATLPAQGGATIRWDRDGVPHITAPNRAALFRAAGWAQMSLHAENLLELYAGARGRAAEVLGEAAYEDDLLIRRFGVPARAVAWHAAQSPAARGVIAAFADGMNRWAAAHRDEIAPRWRGVLPITAVDVLARLQVAIHLDVLGSTLRGDLQRWGSPGSNAIAIGPARSISGHAMLLIQPHSAWVARARFTAMHLTAPGIDFYGVALLGLPIPAMGFSDHHGWAHTFANADALDLFALELAGRGYRLDQDTLAFTTRPDRIAVRRADGTLEQRDVILRESRHGPVVAEREGQAVAARLVGLDRPGIVAQNLAMLGAPDRAAFEAALAQQQLPGLNVVYADQRGEILYVHNAVAPERQGTLADWRGVLPGGSATRLWTEYLPYSAIPAVRNPASGFVRNSNDPPWFATWPQALDPRAYPATLAAASLDLRAQRSMQLLRERERFDLDDLERLQGDTRIVAADRLVPLLTPHLAAQRDTLLVAAGRVLAAWDRTAAPTSRGGPLLARLLEKTGARVWQERWDGNAPFDTPRGIADTTAALAALRSAAIELIAAHGRLDVTWGEAYRIRDGGLDLPAAVGIGELGSFSVGFFRPAADGRRELVGGNTFAAVVEFGPTVRARGLLAYGNASRPGHVHNGDQLRRFAAGTLVALPFSRAEVAAATVTTERVP